jgi:hypothetical protein
MDDALTETLDQPRWCPRCGTKFFAPDSDRGALSRATRDEGAPVYVCADCGDREALAEAGGKVVSISEWPISLDALLEEDRRRYRQLREMAFRPGIDG